MDRDRFSAKDLSSGPKKIENHCRRPVLHNLRSLGRNGLGGVQSTILQSLYNYTGSRRFSSFFFLSNTKIVYSLEKYRGTVTFSYTYLFTVTEGPRGSLFMYLKYIEISEVIRSNILFPFSTIR